MRAYAQFLIRKVGVSLREYQRERKRAFYASR